ncbi:DNA cytosine methyltransferase [Agromyces sp. G08B096]|uniref:DNA (cytosine-5-)-methyltransferase n=1 Tax=Agromyces sp. G08B096 TaxID=3156399 RepID=A0AAU7W4V8_9MICO
MSALTIGSLCSGYGGLDLAVEEFFAARTEWFAEFEDAPSRVLEHHWPGVPNLGDMTRVDWSQVEPVDIVTGGTPCQDLSAAGRRRGMTEGTRSNLWVQMRECIAATRPSVVVWENVRGAYSARADSDVEHEQGLLGVAPDRPALRALGRVLGDLSDLGFDTEWVGLRASDAGAPHGRFRVFVVAHRRPSDTSGDGFRLVSTPHDHDRADALGDFADGRHAIAPDARSEAVGLRARLRPIEPTRLGRGRPADHVVEAAPDTDDRADHRERARPESRRGSASASDADLVGGAGRSRATERSEIRRVTPEWSGEGTRWGAYEPAIRRWERVLGRVAPSPTNPDGRGGSQRLAPEFVEWMMGLPAGWVTDVAGISRNQMLRMLGNGVVPQQAALAIEVAWERLGDVRQAVAA